MPILYMILILSLYNVYLLNTHSVCVFIKEIQNAVQIRYNNSL